MRELFHSHGCDARWMLYIDADVIITDLSFSLESLIDSVNNPIGFDHDTYVRDPCSFIGQLSSTTINSGVMFFRIDPYSLSFIRQ